MQIPPKSKLQFDNPTIKEMCFKSNTPLKADIFKDLSVSLNTGKNKTSESTSIVILTVIIGKEELNHLDGLDNPFY